MPEFENYGVVKYGVLNKNINQKSNEDSIIERIAPIESKIKVEETSIKQEKIKLKHHTTNLDEEREKIADLIGDVDLENDHTFITQKSFVTTKKENISNLKKIKLFKC